MRLASRLIAATAAALPGAGAASADRPCTVTITNVTRGQTFTPIPVATHARRVRLVEPGEPASPELEILAEAGDIGPLGAALQDLGQTDGEGAEVLGPFLYDWRNPVARVVVTRSY